eukprot:3525870-Pyramimonas_sp.AAC.1
MAGPAAPFARSRSRATMQGQVAGPDDRRSCETPGQRSWAEVNCGSFITDARFQSAVAKTYD